MAGYSKRSTAEKLGIKENMPIVVINNPDDYKKIIGVLPRNVSIVSTVGKAQEFIHYFSKSKRDLEKNFPKLKKALLYSGTLWVSWPKKASKITSDLDDNVVRNIGLNNGLVDIKVAAVDEVWSGIKFVYRLKDRK